MRRLASMTAVASLLLMLGQAPALAQEGPPAPEDGSGAFNWAQPLPDPGEVGVEVGTITPLRPGGRGGGAGPSPCGYVRVEDPEILELYQAEHPGQDGEVYISVCTFEDGRARNFGVNWYPNITPEELALRAVERMREQLPEIAVGVNPPGPQLVTLPTWLWVEPASWRPVTVTAAVPGVTATVTATPQRVTWEMGDGQTVVCDGPGEPYTPADVGREPGCGHTYRQSSAGQPGGAYPVTAAVTYEVVWEAVGAPGGGVLPPVTSTTELALQVAEVQALN